MPSAHRAAAIAGVLLTVAFMTPAYAQSYLGAVPSGREAMTPFRAPDALVRWINTYRTNPEPRRLPEAVAAMVRHGVFKDSENSGLYIGFIAGVLGSNPKAAPDLVAKLFPMPAEDQAALIKAIAYSGLKDWQDLLRNTAERMPARAVLIDRFLTGKMPPLEGLALDAGSGPLDILWGYYYASGSYVPVLRLVSVLKWSKEGDNVERLTVGSMAKWTLATNASRDMELLGMLKSVVSHETGSTRVMLAEVIEAADVADTSKIRKEALAAIETLKAKGPESARKFSWWGQAGQTALALGCIVASTLGQAAVGVPCVIGGAVSGAALKVLAPQ